MILKFKKNERFLSGVYMICKEYDEDENITSEDEKGFLLYLKVKVTSPESELIKAKVQLRRE